jgi:hypothetical protein
VASLLVCIAVLARLTKTHLLISHSYFFCHLCSPDSLAAPDADALACALANTHDWSYALSFPGTNCCTHAAAVVCAQWDPELSPHRTTNQVTVDCTYREAFSGPVRDSLQRAYRSAYNLAFAIAHQISNQDAIPSAVAAAYLHLHAHACDS